MVALAQRCIVGLASRPQEWPREFVVQCALVVRRCALPLALSAAFLGFAVNVIVVGVVIEPIGAEDRLGALSGLDSLREFAAWPSGMILAGIAGTAICSDLGARKVREELDALEVLGVDLYRALVLPRVLAMTCMAPLLYLWALFFSLLLAGLLAPVWLDIPAASYWQGLRSILTIDLFAGMVKLTLIGFIVGVVSCYKGVNATGGSGGVGRGVNQAVVIAFVVTWFVSLSFNAFFQAAFPETQNLR